MEARQGRDAGTPVARRAARHSGRAQRGDAQAHELAVLGGGQAEPDELLAGRRTVVEGYRSTAAFHGLVQAKGLSAPIMAEVNAILYGGRKPADALRALMTRELKRETATPFAKG